MRVGYPIDLDCVILMKNKNSNLMINWPNELSLRNVFELVDVRSMFNVDERRGGDGDRGRDCRK